MATIEIPLTQGKSAIIDAKDYLLIAKYKWRAVLYHNKWWYATTGRRNLCMHNVIMNSTMVDHINHNGLDNRRSNLRLATYKQNAANSRLSSNNTSGYKGVSLRKDIGKYSAKIRVDGKLLHLGYFQKPEEAAEVYDKAAILHFGEFARTNKQLMEMKNGSI